MPLPSPMQNVRSDLPDGFGREGGEGVDSRPDRDRDRYGRITACLAAIRFVLWLGWLVWTSSDHDATR